jgi:hypothetical protein
MTKVTEAAHGASPREYRFCLANATVEEDPSTDEHALASAAPAASLCAGHAQQFGGESPLPNLMEVKG